MCAEAGAADVKLIACALFDGAATAKVCCACGAACPTEKRLS